MDTFSKEERSQIMSKVKSSGNKSTEKAFLKISKEEGLTGWRRNYNIYGKPDFVFPKSRIAIFIDGCFWHGCKKHCRMPASNQEYWTKKIERNKKRDRLVNKTLKDKGWDVVRFWEHELKGPYLRRKIIKLKDKINKG